jgi:hypothetical protein
MTEHWFKSSPYLGIQIVEGHAVSDEEEEHIPAGMTVQINYYLQDTQFHPHPDSAHQDERWQGMNYADDFTFDELPEERTAVSSLLFFAKNFDGPDDAAVCISAGELKEIANHFKMAQ